jgi:adenylosuccinate synthase
LSSLKPKIERILAHHNALRRGLGEPEISADDLCEQLQAIAPKVLPYVDTVWALLDRERRVGKRILFEGAQGALLDIDHGTYPFVTSSNPIAGAACVGAGIGPTLIDEVWGIAKAYTTRVGSGPFPSEIENEVADKIRDVGAEFGTTTGRARRIGWLDLVALKYATRLNGLTGLCLTKLDVLSGIETLRVATSYSNADGATFDEFPYHQSVLHHARAEYVDMPGWEEDITEARAFEDLPETCRNYLNFVSEFLDVPIVLVGVGPERTQVITAGALAEQLV